MQEKSCDGVSITHGRIKQMPLIRFSFLPYEKGLRHFQTMGQSPYLGGGGGEGVVGSIFAWLLASQSPYPIIVYSVANYILHLSHLWANMEFLRSQLIHFLFNM